jgi:excisionase family DNA binding protein
MLTSSVAGKPKDEVLTLPEAAAFLRVPEEVLEQLAARQVVPARKLGEEWRFLKQGLQDWLRQGPAPDERSAHAAPWWLEYPPVELLLAEVERRLLQKLTAAERPEGPRDRKQRLLDLAGKWQGDPALEEMLGEIYKRRGRPMTEEGE